MFPIKDDQPRYSTPYVNTFLIGLNIVVYFLQWSQMTTDPRAAEHLARTYGEVPAHLAAFLAGSHRYSPEQVVLPFFTSMFLHGSWMHVLGNMWFLYIFGDNIEDYLGHFTYLVFYLLCGLIAMATQVAVYPHSNIPTVGASGAIAGVLGAYFLLYPRARVLTAFFLFTLVVPVWMRYPNARMLIVVVVLLLCLAVRITNPRAGVLTWFLIFLLWIPAWIILGYWFVLQFLEGVSSLQVERLGRDVGGVAVWAHVGGMIAGAVMVKLFPERGRRNPYAYR
jgi:membrane associated rhomboid family serine protease